MRKLVPMATVLALVSFLLIPGVLAQMAPSPGAGSEPTPGRPSEMTPSMPPGDKTGTKSSPTLGASKELYASNLIGANVKNPQGETLGAIKELVLDPGEAKIKNAVVSVGGVLGIGAKSVAIPWDEVTLQSDGRAVVVAMAKEELQNAPEWKKPAEETKPPASEREPAATSPMGTRPGTLGR